MRYLGVVRSLNSLKEPNIHEQTFFMIDVFLLTFHGIIMKLQKLEFLFVFVSSLFAA